ncbi:MAG: ATP-dependent Clp protease ATP-binding subunit, partial [Alphaproteobacteria bacterium]|nr:ATP-dependent Clp protease ATP-binding subunit [Alphaproteobacteria bacterium]
DLAVSRNPQVLPYEQQIAKYNTAIQKLHTDLNQLGGVKRDPVVLPASEIEKAASAETRQPVGGISGRLKDNLRNGMALMKESVFGQDDVLAPIVASLQRAATGLNDPNRPLGTFMIAGPPGVGKSWIGKQIALKLFGSEEFFEVVDMENYKEKHTVSALLGAPPGYEGYGKLGKLIEIGQKKPFCVLLLDEIEKAHYDVRQALLKMKGSGRLVGFDGEEADFRNIVIVETTNYGQDIWVSHDFKTAESLFQDRIRHDTTVFSPEYLDRNDAVLCAKPLDEQALTQIVGREVGKLQKAAARKNPDLKIDYRPEELNLFVRDHCLNVSGRRAEMMINKIFGDRVAGLLLESGDAPLSGTLSARRDPATKEFVFNFAAGDSAPAPQAAAVFGRLAV